MNLIYFSDTHGHHRDIDLPDGDILICGGGISEKGTDDEIIDFIRWFDKQKHFYKVFIAGRSDISLDPNHGGRRDISDRVCDTLASYCINQTNVYLENSHVEIEGLIIAGISTSLGSPNYAFTVQESRLLAQQLHKIPKSTHILLTNYPPYGILDYVPEKNDNVGDRQLKAWIDYIKPDVLLTGGVHQSRGITFRNEMAIINGSIYDASKNHVRDPWHMFYTPQTGKIKVWKDITPFKV